MLKSFFKRKLTMQSDKKHELFVMFIMASDDYKLASDRYEKAYDKYYTTKKKCDDLQQKYVEILAEFHNSRTNWENIETYLNANYVEEPLYNNKFNDAYDDRKKAHSIHKIHEIALYVNIEECNKYDSALSLHYSKFIYADKKRKNEFLLYRQAFLDWFTI